MVAWLEERGGGSRNKVIFAVIVVGFHFQRERRRRGPGRGTFEIDPVTLDFTAVEYRERACVRRHTQKATHVCVWCAAAATRADVYLTRGPLFLSPRRMVVAAGWATPDAFFR